MNIYLIILISYSALMIALGAFASWRVRQSTDFFIAGRGLGAGYLAVTLIAANIGAGSTVGAAGLGYRDGLAAWWWVGSAGIGSLILALTVGPKIWTIARDRNLYTVGDYLEYRYSHTVRLTVAVLLWIGSLVILSAQLIAIAWILNVVAGINKITGCLLGALVVTVYFTAGGLHSAVRVNLLQLVVKFFGFALALIFGLKASGSIDGLTTMLQNKLSSASLDSYLSITGTGAAAVSRYVVALVPSFIISPGLLQKVFGARDGRAVRWGVGLNALCLLLFAIVPVTLGMIARGHLAPLDNRELALPMVLTQVLPLWIGALLLAAIFSAEVSTADVVLFMLTTSLGKDFYKGSLRPDATDKQLLQFTRWSAVVCGAIGAILAILLQTVIGALTVFYSLITAVFFLPLIGGLYWPRVTARAALLSIAVSVPVLFVLEVALGITNLWGAPSLLIAIAAGAIALLVAALSGGRA